MQQAREAHVPSFPEGGCQMKLYNIQGDHLHFDTHPKLAERCVALGGLSHVTEVFAEARQRHRIALNNDVRCGARLHSVRECKEAAERRWLSMGVWRFVARCLGRLLLLEDLGMTCAVDSM